MEVQSVEKKSKSIVSPYRASKNLHNGHHDDVVAALRGANIQAKLAVSQPDDKFELEADRVAEKVVSMPDNLVQHNSQAPQRSHNVNDLAQSTTPANEESSERSDEKESELDDELIQTQTRSEHPIYQTITHKPTENSPPTPFPAISSILNNKLGAGRRLTKSMRHYFEPRMNNDFSNVRIHTDNQANELANSIDAKAFAHGQHIVFADHQYAPTTLSGKKLLAHELTHIVQQNGQSSSVLSRTPADDTVVKCRGISIPFPDKAEFAENDQLNTIRQSIFQAQNRYFYPPSQGFGVRLIQRFLLNTLCAGFEQSDLEENLGSYNAQTKKAVIQFQGTHQDANNKALVKDGKLGPATLGSMDQVVGLEPIAPSLDVTDKSVCLGKGKHGPGIVKKESDDSWRIANFDIDKNFIKPRHFDELRDTIVPELKDKIKLSKGKRKIALLGGASTTASLDHNLPLSRRRVECVYDTLVSLGIDKSSITLVSAVGDVLSELALSEKRLSGVSPTINDIENPMDRMVLMSLTGENKDKKSTEFSFIINCIKPNVLQVIIFDKTSANWRMFNWIPVLAQDCRFVPLAVQASKVELLKPMVLADGIGPSAKSDFTGATDIESIHPTDDFGMGKFKRDGVFQSPLVGEWDPSGCNNSIASRTTSSGILIPIGGIKTGVPTLPKGNDCKEKSEEKETCSAVSTTFEATIKRTSVSLTSVVGKIGTKLKRKLRKKLGFLGGLLDLIPDPQVRSEQGVVSVGTKKSAEEKTKTGEDATIHLGFAGVRLEDDGEFPVGADLGQTLAPLTTSSKSNLDSLSWGLSSLKLKGNSNISTLNISGLGEFRFASLIPIVGCRKGKPDRTAKVLLTPLSSAKCDPLFKFPTPSEENCPPDKTDDCSVEERLQEAYKFTFKVAPLSNRGLFSEIGMSSGMKKSLFGCLSTSARVNVEGTTLDGNKIWRPFVWIESTPYCGFQVDKTNIDTYGFAPLALSNPDSSLDPGVFLSTKLESNQWKVPLVLAMAMPGKFTHCTRADGAISEGGMLIPAGPVDCGKAPEPKASKMPADKCDSQRVHINRTFEMAEDQKDTSPVYSRTSFVILLNKPINKMVPGEIIDPALHAGLNYMDQKIALITKYEVLDTGIDAGRYYATFKILTDPCVFNEYNQRTIFAGKNCKETKRLIVTLFEPIIPTEPTEVKLFE